MSNIVSYDKTEEFNEKIKESLDTLTNLCKESNIPFFAVFAVQNGEKGTKYIQEGIFPAVREIALKDDKIREISHIMHNYSTVDTIDIPEIDTDFPSTL